MKKKKKKKTGDIILHMCTKNWLDLHMCSKNYD